MRIISPGVDFTQFHHQEVNTVRDDFQLPSDGKILLSLGRMVKNKGYHHSITAFAELKKMYTAPVYLVVVGGSNEPTDPTEIAYIRELHTLIHSLHLEDSVFIHPSVSHDRVPALYSCADIFLMSSEHEPFGLVTIEAMASGLPVLAHNSGGSVSILTHNRDGILTDFHTPRRVAVHMLSLLKDSDFYERISQTARKHVKRDYDWFQKSEQFAQVYRGVSREEEKDMFQERVKKNYFIQQYFS